MVYKKGQKLDKSKLVAKFVGIIVRIILRKNISQIAGKIFDTHSFFTDHLNCKTVNKRNCRTSSISSHELCAHWLKSFATLMIVFRGFQDFLIIFWRNVFDYLITVFDLNKTLQYYFVTIQKDCFG